MTTTTGSTSTTTAGTTGPLPTPGRPATPAGRTRPPADLTGAPGIPFGRLLRVEARKLVDTRAGRGLLVVIALFTLGAVVAQVVFGSGDALHLGPLMLAALVPQSLLVPVFGVLAVTSEVSQRTGLVTYALEPRRWRVVAAKALAAVLFSLAMLALGALVAAVAHLVAVGTRGVDPTWGVSAGVVAGVVLSQCVAVLQGVAFGLFFRSTAVALVVYFLLPVALTMLTGVVAALRDVRPWVDLASAQVVLSGGATSGVGWAHLATAVGLWVVLPLALGTWLLTRRDVA